MWFLLAAASALCFGLRGILYQWTSQRPIERNLMLFGVYLSGTLIALAASLIAGSPWTAPVWMGLVLGCFSFTSNAAMYKGYAVGKASLVAIFTGLPPLVVVLLAYLLWGEKLSRGQLLAFVIIIIGILMIRYSNNLSLRNLQGAQWGVIAMLFFGLTDLSTKQAALMGAATLPTLTLMFASGAVLFWAAWRLGLRSGSSASARAEQQQAGLQLAAAAETAAAGHRSAPPSGPAASSGPAVPKTGQHDPAEEAPRPWSRPRTVAWGMIVGITNVSGMILVMPAFRLGVTGLVSVVIAMNVVLVLLYARLGLREKFTRLETAGLLASLAGIVILRLAS